MKMKWKGLKIILGRERAGITIFWYLRGEGWIKTLDKILGDQKKGLRERGGELLEIKTWNYGEEIKDLGIIIRVSEKGRGLKKKGHKKRVRDYYRRMLGD